MAYYERDPALFQEHKAVQKPALEVLEKLGYNILSPEDALIQRGNLSNVLLKDILKRKLIELNTINYKSKNLKFSNKNIKQAMNDIDIPLTIGLVKTNEKIYDLLMLGKSYEENLEDGAKKSFSLKYIDWENIDNNEFTAVEEYSVEIEGSIKTKRPDIVLFVNGIPFGVIECKRESVDVDEAVSQNIGNQRTNKIPQLYKFIQLLLATNNNNTKYGTCATPKKFWSVWKEENEVFLNKKLKLLNLNRTPTKQDKDLISLFSPERLMELSEHFILFDVDVKKVPRYQQYFATQKFIDNINEYDENGNRQSGVIWHTQGSGKSLTMVMFAKYIFSRLGSSEPKVVVVTDRKDLDDQIWKTFNHTKLRAAKANTGNHLVDLIKNNSADIVTTIINKFETASKKLQVQDSKDIFVLVDESHRSNYGEMYQFMKKLFPNACYIGFTGTPLMKSEKNTMIKFGKTTKPIHQYTIVDAVEDKAIVPLLYEGKFIPQDINKAVIDKRLEQITKRLTPQKKEEVKKRWAKFEKIASTDQRIQLIAADIEEHYIQYIKDTPFNAMLATNSKIDAIKYLNEFELNSDLNCEVVISHPDDRLDNEDTEEDDIPENQNIVKSFWEKMMKKYKDEDNYQKTIKSKFVYGDDIDILIVVDKLLTGFDAPKTNVLYIDKQLKEHNLLQAIARVNRLYEGKDYGLIIDYRGLLSNLNEAIDMYSGSGLDKFEEDEIRGAIYDVIKVLGDLRDGHQNLIKLFNNIKDKNKISEYSDFLENDELRDEFYELLSKFGRNLTIAFESETIYNSLTEKEINIFKKDLRFFRELRQALISRYTDKLDHKEYEKQMQKLMDNYITSGEVQRLTKPIDILDKVNFDKELDRLGSKRSKADAIRTRMSQSISKHWDENPTYYQNFSDKIKEILDDYKNKRITEVEYLNAYEDLYKKYTNPSNNLSNYPSSIKSYPNAQALYGTLNESFAVYNRTMNLDNEIAELSTKIDKVILKHKKIDFKNNTTVFKVIEQEIEDLICDFRDEKKITLPYPEVDKIIETYRNIIKKRY